MIALEKKGKTPLLLPQLDEVTGRPDRILRVVLLVTLLELHLGLSWGSRRPSLCSQGEAQTEGEEQDISVHDRGVKGVNGSAWFQQR